MIKRLLTKWYILAALFAIATITAVGMVKVDAERREYMTAEEYENISAGMTLQAVTKVTEAKPNQDTRYLGNDLFVTYYWGDKDRATEVSIVYEEVEKDKYIVTNKDKRERPQ